MYTYGEKPPQWEIGRRLQAARETAGLTREEAAKTARVSPSRWRQVEDGSEPVKGQWKAANPTPERLARMCHAVGLPASELLPHLGGDRTVDDFNFPLVEERLDLDGLEVADLPAVQAFVDLLKQRKH